jgi:alkanesulfonate monooxygenase
MTIALIGMIGVQQATSTRGAAVHVIGGGVDAAYLRDFARGHEEAGCDTVLVGYTSMPADGFTIANYAAGDTQRERRVMALL